MDLSRARVGGLSAEMSLFGQSDGSKRYSAGQLDAYVCERCSDTELFAVGLQHLVHRPDAGICRLEPSSPPPPLNPPVDYTGETFGVAQLVLLAGLLFGYGMIAAVICYFVFVN